MCVTCPTLSRADPPQARRRQLRPARRSRVSHHPRCVTRSRCSAHSPPAGGNVDITDSDGDTPLYTAENIDTARFLVEHGATIDRRNADGVSPIEHLSDEFPDVAAYLSTVSGISQPTTAHDARAEQLTSELFASVADIMERAEADGHDPQDELRTAAARILARASNPN
ncbi:hypothetical protein C0992_001760 [Termitomyces sp. T32_za158]|nr:hypothetical protein C0992_001760 [Termitomyces sp. T32_za158]